MNHLAGFLLTSLLLDLLMASAPARIVTVSANSQAAGKLDFTDLQGERHYSGQQAYSQSKLANVMFTYELARRLDGTGVTATVLHPGVVRTPFAAEDSSPLAKVMLMVSRPFLKTPAQGAATSIYLAIRTRGRRCHRTVFRQPRAQDLEQNLLRHHRRRATLGHKHSPDPLRRGGTSGEQ